MRPLILKVILSLVEGSLLLMPSVCLFDIVFAFVFVFVKYKYKYKFKYKYKYKYKDNLKIVNKIGQHSLQGIAVKIKRSLQGSPVENTHEMLRIWMQSLVWTRAMGFLDLQSFQFFLLKITKMQKYENAKIQKKILTFSPDHGM